jgi:hypothetical protein
MGDLFGLGAFDPSLYDGSVAGPVVAAPGMLPRVGVSGSMRALLDRYAGEEQVAAAGPGRFDELLAKARHDASVAKARQKLYEDLLGQMPKYEVPVRESLPRRAEVPLPERPGVRLDPLAAIGMALGSLVAPRGASMFGSAAIGGAVEEANREYSDRMARWRVATDAASQRYEDELARVNQQNRWNEADASGRAAQARESLAARLRVGEATGDALAAVTNEASMLELSRRDRVSEESKAKASATGREISVLQAAEMEASRLEAERVRADERLELERYRQEALNARASQAAAERRRLAREGHAARMAQLERRLRDSRSGGGGVGRGGSLSMADRAALRNLDKLRGDAAAASRALYQFEANVTGVPLKGEEDQRKRLEANLQSSTAVFDAAVASLGAGASAAVAKPLDAATAAAILREVGGDKAKAREVARRRGYRF